jgi:hypothetical protein
MLAGPYPIGLLEAEMINLLIKKIRQPLFAALIILLCFSFYGCKKAAGATASASAASSSETSAAPSSQSSSAKPQAASSRQSSGSGSAVNSASKAVSSKLSKSGTVTKAAASSSAKYSKSVTLTIDASKGNDGVVANCKKVGINAGDTVYAVLKRYCSQNNILLAATKTGSGTYISSIDGVAQFDCGSQSGWIYSVGGAFPQNDCNSYKLNGGESIKWVYTTDLGKSEEKSK